jgi:hypothetical protein
VAGLVDIDALWLIPDRFSEREVVRAWVVGR